jgi:digeranylgeranylglycerophospholipid reductase
MTDFDVVVVGAGPAGSTAARFSAAGGARTVILEKGDEVGIPVRCSELVPSVATLKKLFPSAPDIEALFDVPDKCLSRRLDGLSLYSPSGKEYRMELECFSVYRARLDAHLASEAVRAGAEIRTGTKARAFEFSGDEVRVETEDGAITASMLIGADGPMSLVRRALDIESPFLHPCVQYTIPGEHGERVEMHFNGRIPGGHAWLVPKSNGANIGLEAQCQTSLWRLLDELIFEMGIFDHPRIETEGLLEVSGPVPTTVSGRTLLVGDAAGQILAFNGWGIPTAMICGRAAGQTAAGFIKGEMTLSDYEKRWKAQVGEPLLNSMWVRRRMERLSFSGLTMELAFAFLHRRGIKKALGCGSPTR